MTGQMAMALKEFRRFTDIYYWKTAYIIAENAILRQYRNSFLGVTWTVVQPLTQVTIFSIVMPLLMRFPVDHYVLYLVVSFPLWAFISMSLVKASESITLQAETLKRCIVSSTVFPVADVLRNLYTYLVSFGAMYLFCLLFVVPWNPMLWLLPIYLLPLVVIIMALAVAIAFLAPYVRDIGELVLVGMNVTFWLTPLVYPLEAVPDEVRDWFWLNPFFVMINPIHDIIYRQAFPSVFATLALLGLTLAAVAVSYGIYRLCRRNYVYYL